MSLYQHQDLRGRVALITGASAGIGEACALRFAEAGCKIIIVARREERLESLSQKIAGTYNVPVHKVVLDVRDTSALLALPSSLPDDFKEVDILVANAGLALGTSAAHENSPEDIETMISTNVTAVMVAVKAFAPGMIERNRGHIIVMGSIAGHEAYAGGSVYCATKHAIRAFTDAMRHDLVGTPVRCTCVSPGAVQTEFSIVRFRGDKDKADAVYEGIEPLTGADIADAVMYAATAPQHVQVADMVILATHQSSAKGLARVLKSS